MITQRKPGRPGKSRRPHPSRYRVHVRAQEQVRKNERWYGDGPPSLPSAFAAAKTAERHARVIKIVRRAANRARKAGNEALTEALNALVRKFGACKPGHRCGSCACILCARAFQRAKAAAGEATLTELLGTRLGKELVFITLIPNKKQYELGEFPDMDIPKANRWLKDVLKPIGMNRPILGSADLSWENRDGKRFLQLHWHLAMWTSNRDNLERKLKTIFVPRKKYAQPVDVAPTYDLKFLPYMNKVIRLPDRLRDMKTHLPELLLVLDRTDPLDFVVTSRLRLSAQTGGIVIS